MTNKSLIFAGIFAAILGNNAFATGENTVTSKSYVDAMDATKQDKITAKTSGNVVTYNGTNANGQAQFDERAIFDYETSGEWDENNEYQLADGHEGDLMTAGDVIPAINDMYNAIADVGNNANNAITNVNNEITNINNQLNGQTLESIGVPSLTCANQECTLYQVTTNAGIAHKLYSCTTATVATDCPACGTGTKQACVDSICKCNACKADGVLVSSSSECCSGQSSGGMCCGTSGGMNCGDR